jgi:hypothetical protein
MRIVITDPDNRTSAVAWYESGKPEWTAITGYNEPWEHERRVTRMRVYQLLGLWGLRAVRKQMPNAD